MDDELRELIDLALDLIERGSPGISEAAVEAWLSADEEMTFPQPGE